MTPCQALIQRGRDAGRISPPVVRWDLVAQAHEETITKLCAYITSLDKPSTQPPHDTPVNGTEV